ncbi:hypothetical protein IFR05_004438 [Cadophora sp. M221]|nr:hypothetical protein IFR05_004438 [Cadophora sp. M221]
MVKLKNTKPPNKAGNSRQSIAQRISLAELKGNADLWYKLKVLIYDLANIKNDPASVTRLERTVDELYISEPYFAEEDAGLVKITLVPISSQPDGVEEDSTGDAAEESQMPEQLSEAVESKGEMKTETVDESIKRRMANFYDKRRASGDFRPCGPHDMVPVYLGVFGLEKGELEDERFLGRLRRAGIERGKEVEEKVEVGRRGREKRRGRKGGGEACLETG